GSAVNELAVNGAVLRRVEIRPQSGIGYGFANFGASPAVAYGSAVNELAVNGTVLRRAQGPAEKRDWLRVGQFRG
ncbi:MAG: hypothetical protein RLY70_1352, partial [Planctomycetota bacterium]